MKNSSDMRLYDETNNLTTSGVVLHDELVAMLAAMIVPYVKHGHSRQEVVKLVGHAAQNIDIFLTTHKGL